MNPFEAYFKGPESYLYTLLASPNTFVKLNQDTLTQTERGIAENSIAEAFLLCVDTQQLRVLGARRELVPALQRVLDSQRHQVSSNPYSKGGGRPMILTEAAIPLAAQWIVGQLEPNQLWHKPGIKAAGQLQLPIRIEALLRLITNKRADNTHHPQAEQIREAVIHLVKNGCSQLRLTEEIMEQRHTLEHERIIHLLGGGETNSSTQQSRSLLLRKGESDMHHDGEGLPGFLRRTPRR